jgi:hypothetical protein
MRGRAMPAKKRRELRDDVSRDEGAILAEICGHGTGSIPGLRRALAAKGVRVTAGEIEGRLRSLRSKGWVRRTNWRWHLTDAAIQYMR